MQTRRLLDGRLKLRHLVLVDALVEHGTVAGAAAHLHMTQPAASRSLQELESILGVSLFERGPRGVTPTIFGTAFGSHARAILAQLSQAGRHVDELARAGRGTVTVGTHLAGSNLLLPRAIASLKARHPHVTVVVHEASPAALYAALESGRIDLIVGRLSAARDGSGSGTVQTMLYDEPIQLVARTGHPTFATPNPQLADLIDYPWILPGAETALRRELERVFVRQGLALPENRIECTSILTVRQLLVETDVIAALPMLIARDESRIAALPISLEPMSHTIGVTRLAGHSANPSTAVLLEELDAVAARMRSSVSGA